MTDVPDYDYPLRVIREQGARIRELEAENEDLTARLIEAADALSPAIGATVGGRGVALAAKHVAAKVSSVEALAYLWCASEGVKDPAIRVANRAYAGVLLNVLNGMP